MSDPSSTFLGAGEFVRRQVVKQKQRAREIAKDAAEAERRRAVEREQAPQKAKANEFLKRRRARGFQQSILSSFASPALKTTFGE